MSWRAAALIGLFASCNRDPEIVARPIVVHSPRSCPVPDDPAGKGPYSVIYAGGDFDDPPQSSQYLREVGRELSALPASTRSLVVDVSANDFNWRGVGEVPAEGTTNVLLWRGEVDCALTGNVEPRTDMAFAVFGHRFMVVGGRAEGSAAPPVPHTFVGDLTTGVVESLPYGLKTSRLRPTVTAFGDGALVAGGSVPGSTADTPLGTAEIYSASLGDFEPATIGLAQERMDHGAVELGTGETLLVGGKDRNGLLRTMEIVDPVTRRARTAGLAELAVARTSPIVRRLASGEILVAGGFDAKGAAVPTLEWFSRDASQPTKRRVDLVTGKERAFVPLEAGGALAVIRPDTPAADFQTVWIISADGTLEPATPIDPATLESVRLFRGGDGAPILWTGRRWLKWAPWAGAFVALDRAPAGGPELEAIDNGDPGLALWVTKQSDVAYAVTGFRFAAHTPFEAVRSPLLEVGPLSLAPDRLVSGGGGAGSSTIRFDERGVVLEPGASVFVTNVSFADFTLDVDITGAAPIVVVRDARGEELEVGGATCGFGQSATRTLHVVRRGPHVEVSADGAATRPCPTALAEGLRVSLGIRGAEGAGVSAARNLRIARGR